MGYGRDMENYTLTKTWSTPLVLVTTPKIGSLLKLPGMVFALPACYLPQGEAKHIVKFYSPIFRKKDDNTYQGTTWQIKFKLDNVNKSSGSYKLRVALASATFSELQVNFL